MNKVILRKTIKSIFTK